MFGYMGKILIIDLSSGSHCVEELREDFARAWLGGNGFAAAIIHSLVPPEARPLSPENAVVFASGPINATPVWIPPDRLGPIYPAAERSQRIAGRLRDLSTALGTPARVENGRVVVRISPPTASAQSGVGEQPAQNSAPAPGV